MTNVITAGHAVTTAPGTALCKRITSENASLPKKFPIESIHNNQKIGGVVVKIDKDNKKGELDLFFINPENHSKGAGYSAWLEIEKMFPEIEVWETVTPYFEKRNIHFYVNKCGFHIVEFFHKFHPSHHLGEEKKDEDEFEMFRFQKIIKK